MPLLKSLELWENEHLLVEVGLALCILLWYAAKFKSDQILMDAPRLPEQSKQSLKEGAAAAAPSTVEPSTPQAPPPFGRLNPIQSVERQRRRRSESEAAITAADEAASTPRLCQNFRCLNPDQSVERHRRKRFHTKREVQHLAEPATNESKLKTE